MAAKIAHENREMGEYKRPLIEFKDLHFQIVPLTSFVKQHITLDSRALLVSFCFSDYFDLGL